MKTKVLSERKFVGRFKIIEVRCVYQGNQYYVTKLTNYYHEDGKPSHSDIDLDLKCNNRHDAVDLYTSVCTNSCA